MSKALFPGLMTFVRKQATEIPAPTGGRFDQLDACDNHFKAEEGDVGDYITEETEAAEALGLGVIFGLNMVNGGDGSSGQVGMDAGMFAMSGDELRAYGRALIAEPICGMFLGWEYDGASEWADGTIGSAYFDHPDRAAALVELGRLAAVHPPVELLKP